MNTGKTLLALVMDFLPWKTFHRIVQNVNAYDSRLKGWIRCFRGVATHYLGQRSRMVQCYRLAAGAGINPASLLASAVRV